MTCHTYDTTICIAARETMVKTITHSFQDVNGDLITTTDWTGVVARAHIRQQAAPGGVLIADLSPLPTSVPTAGVLQIDLTLDSALTEDLPPVSYIDIWADRPDPFGSSLALRAKIEAARTVTRI